MCFGNESSDDHELVPPCFVKPKPMLQSASSPHGCQSQTEAQRHYSAGPQDRRAEMPDTEQSRGKERREERRAKERGGEESKGKEMIEEKRGREK